MPYTRQTHRVAQGKRIALYKANASSGTRRTKPHFDAVGREFLINDMVLNTSLTFNEAATAIDYLFRSIPKYISLGHTVIIGKMGYFTIGIKSEGSATEEEATLDKIKRKRLIFIAGPEVRKLINDLPAEKHTKMQ